MNRVTVVLVGVAAAVTLAVTIALTSSHSSSLPVPKIPVVAQVTHGNSGGKGSGLQAARVRPPPRDPPRRATRRGPPPPSPAAR